MTRGQSVPTSPVHNEWLPSGKVAVAAAGSTQSGGTAVPSGQDLTVFNTVTSGQGCVLPGSGVSNFEEYVIANHGANALLVYPATGGQIGTLGTNTGYSLAAGKTGYFLYVGGNQWTANP